MFSRRSSSLALRSLCLRPTSTDSLPSNSATIQLADPGCDRVKSPDTRSKYDARLIIQTPPGRLGHRCKAELNTVNSFDYQHSRPVCKLQPSTTLRRILAIGTRQGCRSRRLP